MHIRASWVKSIDSARVTKLVVQWNVNDKDVKRVELPPTEIVTTSVKDFVSVNPGDKVTVTVIPYAGDLAGMPATASVQIPLLPPAAVQNLTLEIVGQ